MTVGAFEILSGCVAVLFLLYYYVTYNFDYWKSRGVPGPKPLPLFGNFIDHYLGKNSHGGIYKDIYDKYPTEPMVGMFIRGFPVLIVRDPEYIKQILIKDFSVFTEREGDVYEKADPMSLHLFRIDALRWRPLRTRLSPTFTSGKLKDMFHLVLNCSEQFEKYMNETLPKDGIVECRALTGKFTMDVIGSCAFGLELNTLQEEDNEFYEVGRRIFSTDYKVKLKIILRDLPWLNENFGHLLKDNMVIDFITNITRDTIKYRKQNNIRRNDFVDILIDFKDHPEKLGINEVSDAYIAAQLFVFFAAGFETSSTTMSYAMYELALNQSMQEKVRKEIKEVLDADGGVIIYDSLKKMSYLNKIFQETLRKYPPVMFLMRKPISKYTFQGTKITLDKGLKTIIPIYGIHHDPNIYPDPEVFDPERFSEENIKQRNPMYYLPFGDGPRNCIGARFASKQSFVGLIKVLINYKIDVCEKTQKIVMDPNSFLMLTAKEGIYVKLTKLA